MIRKFRILLVLPALLLAGSCSKQTPSGINLVKNSSFEEVADGLPADWTIKNFRGIGDSKAATYRLNERQVYHGERSFNFVAEEDTKMFYILSQEVAVKDIRNIRIRAAIKTAGVKRNEDQFPQAGMALTFYNKFRGRFNSQRFADVRTDPVMGSTDGWQIVDRVFGVPVDAAFVEVMCVLGMEGRIWFDDVTLEVPVGLPWHESETEHFTHHWLGDDGFPEGSIAYQEQLYDYYATRLAVPEEDRPHVYYYLYPDTASIRETLGIDGYMKVDHPRGEVHSINPVDNHEIVHMLTGIYGKLPRMLAEGTAFYLMDDFMGEPIQPLAQRLLKEDRLLTLEQMIDPLASHKFPAARLIPAGASFVGYLLEFGGPERFKALHRASHSEMTYATFTPAFEAAYGGSLVEAEKVWRATLLSADFSRQERPQRDGEADGQ
jgi:hypothetical protein